MQLDLFADSRDVLLRNDTISALRVRHFSAAQTAYAKLAGEYPGDRLLEPLARLLTASDCSTAVLSDFESAATACASMDALASAAAELFGPGDAVTWLNPLWQGLAQRLAGLPFSPDFPDVHSAAILLRARDWSAAERAVGNIPSWRRLPQTLAWMAEARHAGQGLAAAWPLLVELAWLTPIRFEQLLTGLNNPALARLLKTFKVEFQTEASADLAWFPAWALVTEPNLASVLHLCEATRETLPERAFQLMLNLLDLERQGRHADLIEGRKRLRDLHAGLFDHYMRTR